MSALTSLLVRDEVVSVQTIEDALARQVLEDGEIDTALLELDAARENMLNGYRAASFGLPAASREDLMGASAETLSRVPAELASKHRIVPIARRDGTLHIACAHPLEPDALRSIEHALGAAVEWHIATEVRVEAALAQHYRFEIAPRMRRLAEQVGAHYAGELPTVEPLVVTHRPDSLGSELFGNDGDDGDGDGESSAPPASHDNLNDAMLAASAVPLPPPTMISERGAQSKPVEFGRVVSISAPPPAASTNASVRTHSEDVTERMPGLVAPKVPREHAHVSSLTPVRGTPLPRVRRFSTVPKGPLSGATARELLDAATERDDVVDVFFSYARQYFESTALFAVREDRALGLESFNTPAVDDIRELSILFESSSALEELTKAPNTRVLDLSRKDVDHALALALGRMHMQPSALIPVCIRQRVVSFVYGDRAGEPFRLNDIAELTELLPSVSQAFERIIRNRKVFAMQSRRPPAAQAAQKAPSVRPERSLTPAPRAAWSSPPPASVVRPSRPPPRAAIESALRPHEVPTPAARPRRSGTSTLSGLAAEKRTPTARDMHGAGLSSAPPPPPVPARSSRDSRADTPFAPMQRVSRAALSSLGVPRSAPPPPRPANAREVLEQQPTMHLPAQRGSQPSAADSGRPSKPPPGAGAYHEQHEAPAHHDRGRTFHALDSANVPDVDESPETPRPRPSKPPARQSKAPPGTGSYKMHGGDSEIVSLPPPPRVPEPAGPSSQPPKAYVPHERRHRSREIITIPPPPRLPDASPAPIAEEVQATRRRESAAAITQPLGPRRPSKRPPAPDARRDDRDSSAPTEIVRMSKSVRDSLRPSAPESSKPEASIIVDTSTQLKQLVYDLCRSGPDDEGRMVEALLRSGDAVLPLLVASFPGPLWFDRRRAHPRLPMGRDISAIARALSAFGERAWPQLAELLCDANADTRFYATLLVSDQVIPQLLGVLGDRLFDSDPQLRLIVKDVLPLYRQVPGFSDTLQRLRESAQSTRASIQDRLAALDALATMRDVGSVQLLIRLNEDSDKQVSLPAHRALVTITGQDFGSTTRKWQVWLDDNAGKPRAVWLIESLMHADQPVRASAGIELQKLTQVYYGYVAAAPKKERERTQRRYQDWWQTDGRKRFTE